MQITLRPDVEKAILAAACGEDRSPTNLVNKILADWLAKNPAAESAAAGQKRKETK